jgi:hypothetical protein
LDKVLFLDDQVIDEKNMPGKTLGARRLQCGRKDLLPLKKAALDVADLIHCKTKYFVDNEGNPWIYQKTYNSRLKSYRIRKIEKKEVASLLWLYGWSTPFTIPRPPLNNPLYARFLHLNGNPWLLYDYSHVLKKSTYRRV